MKKLNELIGIPSILGQPIYVNGFPAPSDNVYMQGVSLKELYYKKVESDNIFSQLEFEILSNFLAYSLHAPILNRLLFLPGQQEQLEEMRTKSLQIENWNDFANVLAWAIDNRIDPFD